ncbi:hypothetical protein NDU88_008642 [Pleurodeles waltl]|uniref:Uncharacterized protein n=1 Tax=Pleurodeles waltl TaxID=8319 RepID=A0AAV7QSE4_PLEWA|nr:hypothetical protein NDU88_008642 [Pleurodeles waltl]
MAGQLGCPAGPGTEDWRAGKIIEGRAAVCGSVGAGAGTEPPTWRSGAEETGTVDRTATSAARIAWAGLWCPSPPGSITAPPAGGRPRRPAPHESGGRGPGGEAHRSSGDSLTRVAAPIGPAAEDWLAGATAVGGAATCGSVGAGTEPLGGGAVQTRRAP